MAGRWKPGRLDLSRLDGVAFYEPGELVFSALAGTSIETIETMLANNAQELAFEPMSFAALYATGSGTIGGAIMANLSGPRRIKAGAARDFVLGVKAVSGRGEAFRAGGRGRGKTSPAMICRAASPGPSEP